ncbi:hypothetical protein TNCV_3935141 [Trichonephila clavipes]|nr:hypothetical protein TNCV_3935141 [Trichonephila clavipes]
MNDNTRLYRAAFIDDYLEEEKIHRIIYLRDRCDGRHSTPSITSRDPLSVKIVPFRRIGAVENYRGLTPSLTI